MKQKCNAIIRVCTEWMKEKYGDTREGLSYFIMITASLFLGFLVSCNMDNIKGFVCVLIISVLSFLGLFLLKPIVKLVFKGLVHYGIWTFLCVVLFGTLVFETLTSGLTPNELSIVPTLFVIVVEGIFVRCGYALIRNKKRNLFVIIPFVVTLALNVVIGVFCLNTGYEASYIEEYRSLDPVLENGNEKVAYEEKYSVSAFTYGKEKDETVQTKTVNLLPYLDSYHGLQEKIRNWYWGYGPDKIPLEGKVWYPKEEGTYPILFIIHGNADMAKESYEGYEYLGKYLAASGYITVSVNENWCNCFMGMGFSDENDARAILLLENMKEVMNWNETSDNPLFQKIQEDRIAIAGHSRGGEAVAIASEFNQYSCYPDDGIIKFDYHFPIETVIAIAPTSNQYNPSGRTVSLKDVNYFLIQGANDQDVTPMMGINQYEHVRFTKNSQKRKAYLYVAGANHGQFNTKWGRYDRSFPANIILNTKPLLNEDDQRDILQQYMKVCLDVSLKGDNENEDFLWNIEQYGKSLPKTVFLQGYQESSYEPVADFQEDGDLMTATQKETEISAEGFTTWQEEKSNDFCDYDSDNYSVCLGWKRTKQAEYELSFPSRDISGETLCFDVMNVQDSDSLAGKAKKMDFTILLTDQNGKTASVAVDDYKTVYPPLLVVYSKVVEKFNMVTYKRNFQTVRICSDDFAKANLEVDLHKISKVRFLFNKRENGKLLVDHIGFES